VIWLTLGVYSGTAVRHGWDLDGGEHWQVLCNACGTQQSSNALDAVWAASAHNTTAAHKLAGVLF